ncbi:MAG: ABC transporter substrate-binding protein [Nitrososphaerales archaeon]
MTDLKLSFACWDYDRTRPLFDGRVRIEGADINHLRIPVEQSLFRMIRYREFDISEMSLSGYAMSLFSENPPFMAIPVFLSREFRHSFIFINADSGIEEPTDLIGKRVGTPEYEMTAGVWIRGILEEKYGVPVNSVQYFTGGQEQPGREEKTKLDLPLDIQIQKIGKNQTLSAMLENGEIDAIYAARAPSCFTRGSKKVRRLFPDHREVEKQYYKDTGIFPIMHLVLLKREVYEANRWLAHSLYLGLLRAKQIAYDDLADTASLRVMLPWLTDEYQETCKLMGQDYWAYGVEPNHKTLSTLLHYSYLQGLSKRELKPEELFAPETAKVSLI